MLQRETRDFVRAALGLQRVAGCPIEEAKQQAGQALGCPVPCDAVFNGALAAPVVRHGRGRPRSPELSKQDAVGAVAAYFESIGARSEQAIDEARHWLGIKLSRKGAKKGAAAFKASTSPDQFKAQASWAYATFRPGVTLPLPEIMPPAPRKKRRAKSDLG